MRIIAGLGNPGAEYDSTRHNIGFAVLDALAARWRCEFRMRGSSAAVVDRRSDAKHPGVLVKPLTYMNRSGEPLAKLLREFEAAPSDLLVVVDDFALELGRLRLRPSGSDGGHNGLKSINAALGGEPFARLRVGIGPCPDRMPSEVFVLQRFRPAEREAIAESIARAVDCAEDWLSGSPLEQLMNRYNSKATQE
jgi:peptidyl-tRNA hydrolase, PTH1 family